MPEKAFDVLALGELLIDFTENSLSGQGNSLFEANPGGVPGGYQEERDSLYARIETNRNTAI